MYRLINEFKCKHKNLDAQRQRGRATIDFNQIKCEALVLLQLHHHRQIQAIQGGPTLMNAEVHRSMHAD